MGGDADIIYDVQTRWKDLHIPTFILTTSAFYFTEQLLTHPFDVIRTKLQVAQQKMTLARITEMVHKAGVRGLYTAFLPAALGFMPGNVVYLLSYAFSKDYLQRVHDKNHPHNHGYQPAWVSFSAGVIADIAAVSLYCPVEVVVQRLFIQDKNNKKYSNTLDAVRKIYREEGLRGFYKGWGTIVVNSIPASAIWWTIYEAVKTIVSKKAHDFSAHKHPSNNNTQSLNNNNEEVVHKHVLGQILGGAIAGGCVTTITNPLDMIRTRLQTQHLHASPPEQIISSEQQSSLISHTSPQSTQQLQQLGQQQQQQQLQQQQPQQYKSLRHAIQTIYKQEGISAFFKGLGPRMSSYVLFSTIGALAYELAVDISTKKR